VDVSTRQINRIVVKGTNFNWEMFNMFNIIETLQNYITRELLLYNLSSKVALHFKLFGGSVMPASTAPVILPGGVII